MGSLFEKAPLPHRIRPSAFAQVIGQEKAKQQLQKFKEPVSILLYGPPGTGKSTIAKILGNTWKLPFVEYNAVTTGVADIKKLLERSEKEGSILLFLDEIHRFSSSQQDSLLKGVETGSLVLIGATTESPSFRITKPLLSRCQVLRLEPLGEKELFEILSRGIDSLDPKPDLTEEACSLLVRYSGGDARKLLSNLEGLSLSFDAGANIQASDVNTFLESRVIEYDQSGESHYDVISAFIKSVRGSDPDAALFYLALMLEGGEDPLFIARRLIILASEDIGNASVHGLPLAIAGLQALETIGMPEGRIVLGQVTSFLASCPKSNASYLGINSALSFVKERGPSLKIPNRLRNAPTALHKKEGASQGYKYPHDFGGFVPFSYFPDDLSENPPQFYKPTRNGMEAKIREHLSNIWKKFRGKDYD
ncbi:replication-associated recombination protein A [Leptospira semungkisensis]|uniref:Replication-associated recombination protein A n=1 Tax=Leptospira semungkisensis TaxID=2484985 RepID=A0A4R9G0R6_9LEPT|nr:replication-associated recombination protein A [Leptospira semungkisensis]TGK04773.1 replication-associated recombination protein A [Leptospira semungkisensis]